jgi:hypothetical protein
MKPGKQFEADFKASVLPDQLYLRLNDAGGCDEKDCIRN